MKHASADPVCILTPVWGRRHVAQFLEFAAPSWLAPGNVPALAAQGGARIRLLTRRDDIQLLERHPIISALREHASIAFDCIDDLMSPGFMPVTLTFAFTRGLQAEARTAAPARCLLLNSDFVFSDGSIGYAGAELRRGAPLLLAPSLRARQDAIAPCLQDAKDAGGVLAMAPRALVRATLDHLHHTVLSSRMDQQLLHSSNAHQLYWRADSDTLIGRAFCLFALGLVLDAPPGPAEAFCDYGMAPLFAPDADVRIMDDSDRFFALEITPSHYESEFTRAGAPSIERIATRLSAWTTDFHRAQSAASIFYRAGARGPAVAISEARSAETIAALMRQLGPAQPLRGHPDWVSSLEGWRRNRLRVGVATVPPEHPPLSCNQSSRPEGVLQSVRSFVRNATCGPAAQRRWWNPYWLLHQELQRSAGCEACGLVEILSYAPAFRVAAPADVRGPELVVGIDLDHWPAMEMLLDALRNNPAPLQRIRAVVFRQRGGALEGQDVARVAEVLDGWAETTSVRAYDLTLDAKIEGLAKRLAERGAVSRPFETFALGLQLAAGTLAMTAANVFPSLRGSGGRVTALLLELAPRAKRGEELPNG